MGEGTSPVQNNLLAFDIRVAGESRREQRLGVGMQRIVKQLLGPGLFDNFAEIHHRHFVRHVARRRQVVGNDQIADVVLLLQIHQEVHDLRPDGHIQGRHRLIQNDQLGIGDQARWPWQYAGAAHR